MLEHARGETPGCAPVSDISGSTPQFHARPLQEEFQLLFRVLCWVQYRLDSKSFLSENKISNVKCRRSSAFSCRLKSARLRPTADDGSINPSARNTRGGCAPLGPCARPGSRWCDTGHHA